MHYQDILSKKEALVIRILELGSILDTFISFNVDMR